MVSSSSSSNNKDVIHFVLFPLMAQGHMLPMLDIAKLLSETETETETETGPVSIRVTILTTPQNASRLQTSLSSHPRIHLALLQVQKLPQGCGLIDNNLVDQQLSSINQSLSFFSSLALLQPQAVALCKALTPKPSCIISDICLPWTLHVATKIGVPWVSFSGGSCFGSVVMSRIRGCGRDVGSNGEYFEVPGLAHKIEITKAQLPTAGVLSGGMMKFLEQIGEAEMKAFGTLVNSFEELEGPYVEELKKVRAVWCVGPVSLCNKHTLHRAQRGKASITDQDKSNNNDQMIMKWLDSQEPKSVLYVCLGSMHNLKTPQLMELGLGLESSNSPFIWVVRASNKLEKWIQEEGFEERIKTRGLVIRDWAPQLLILSHPAIGGFLTHCGWNSVLEAISAGLPMLTWPLFSDQFLIEKMVADVLNIAVKVGAEYPVMRMKEEGEEGGKEEEEGGKEEEMGIIEVKKEEVRKAIERVMGKGDEAEERRKKARELGVMAKNALEDGGSSQLNIRLFIDDIVKVNKVSS